MGQVQGPENSLKGPEMRQTENITQREKKNIFSQRQEEVNKINFKANDKRELSNNEKEREKAQYEEKPSQESSNNFTNDPSVIEARFAAEMSRLYQMNERLDRKLSAFEEEKCDRDFGEDQSE